ncbi:MAG: MiaB/RimO family radical SAM methylthiotransferase [Burkholderiales bacterium]|nr:MiaB/RimO family radical SAM methylthiotransferase [Phycisphaerae bacterium]
MSKKLYLETFGCQMNVLDSELVLSQLRGQGYVSTADSDDADVIIYNTCSVREHAEQKVWSRLGKLRDRKQADPNLVIGVIGCMAEREGAEMFRRHPHIDILCGPAELDKLPGMVHNAVVTSVSQRVGESEYDFTTRRLTDSPRQIALMGKSIRRSSTLQVASDELEMLDLSRAVSPGDDLSQAYVRITRGCNKFCTYCVVPYTRGPEVHRPPTNIIEEVRKLVDAGAMEVTLLGQTINHYFFDHGDGRRTTFADLLYQIHEATPDLPRLRFVTSFPRDFTNEALQAMRDCPRICRYLHAPAQHGSNRVLKLMNRGYTVEQYRDFADRARAMMPDIAIASDFIVGFPTETEAEFEETVDLVKYCAFKNSFIFKYSPRPGTTAIDRFADDIPEDVKRQRNNRLLEVQGQVVVQNNLAMIGKTVEVYVEGVSKLVARRAKNNPGVGTAGVELGSGFRRVGFIPTNSKLTVLNGGDEPHPTNAEGNITQLVGRTRGDQIVVFEGDMSLKGQLVNVRIVDAQQMTLFAERMTVPS